MLLNILSIVAEIITEVATGLFANNNEDTNNETYEYWKDLSYQDQEYYFNNNEYLKDYIKNDYYPNNREITAKHVQQIADKLGREFTNKYDRY
jgi:hypothetical protein